MAERTKATDLMMKRVVDALSEQEQLAFLSFVRLFAAVDMYFGTEGYGERPSVTGRYIDPATRRRSRRGWPADRCTFRWLKRLGVNELEIAEKQLGIAEFGSKRSALVAGRGFQVMLCATPGERSPVPRAGGVPRFGRDDNHKAEAVLSPICNLRRSDAQRGRIGLSALHATEDPSRTLGCSLIVEASADRS
jgi:hypothetical protein